MTRCGKPAHRQEDRSCDEGHKILHTSLTDGGKITKAIWSHWGIESCKWILDMDFGEDASLRRKDNTARNINIINKMVISNLKQEDEELKKQATSLRTLRKAAGWDDKYLEKVLRRF